MAISAQDKILYVANKLGLTTLGQMQGSTGAVYDADNEGVGQIFSSCSQHLNPMSTNLSDNKFEVNEALLIEQVTFYAHSDSLTPNPATSNFQTFGLNTNVVFDLMIGNKVVLKDVVIYGAGGPSTFASSAIGQASVGPPPDPSVQIVRHQIFFEGAGILIPPQVEFSINYKRYNVVTGAPIDLAAGGVKAGACLFGTRVLLNFNTSI